MTLKRVVIAVISFVLCITSVAACGQQKVREEKKERAMGRYVEETIEMPELVKNEKEIVYKMLKNPSGKIEIYGVDFKDGNQSSINNQFRYILEEGQWEKESPEWMIDGESAYQIVYGEDNLLYFSKIENKDKKNYWKLYCIKEDGAKEEVILKDVEPMQEDYSNMPHDVKVLKDNKIVLTYMQKCVLYENGEKVYEMENGGTNLQFWKNKILLNNSANTGCVLYDIDKKIKSKEIPFNQNISAAKYEVDEEGNWYMALNSGIHRLSQNGSVWETIVDGSLNSLGAPAYGINELIKGSDDDFFILLESGNGKREIKHYVYRNDVASVPEKTLSVVSLEENALVRQAITQFQNENQDVKVDFKVLMDEESVTASDAIKLLNTELVAKKGPDIIIMDGLPVSAYIEKGILMDLNDTLKPLLEKNELLPNVVESCKTDGKIFIIPGQIGIPIIFGTKEAVEAGKESLSKLAEYASTKAKSPLLGKKVYGNRDLLEDITKYYGKEFTNINTELDTESLTVFLENVKKISSQTKTAEGSIITEDMRRYSTMGSSLIVNKYAECSISEFKNIIDIYAPFEAMKRIGGNYSTIDSLYVPHSMAGINTASKEKKLASAFLQTMLSKQIGVDSYYDGFTINQKALETFITKPDDFYIGMGDFEATRPEDKKIEEFVQLCKEVHVMSQTDSFLLEMIKNEGDNCFKGTKSAKETAEQISEKSKAYREEQK